MDTLLAISGEFRLASHVGKGTSRAATLVRTVLRPLRIPLTYHGPEEDRRD